MSEQLPPELEGLELDEQLLVEIESDLPNNVKLALLGYLTEKMDKEACARVIMTSFENDDFNLEEVEFFEYFHTKVQPFMGKLL